MVSDVSPNRLQKNKNTQMSHYHPAGEVKHTLFVVKCLRSLIMIVYFGI